MKIYIILYCIAAAAWLSCNKTDYSDIGGRWQLKTVEQNGQTTKVDTVWYDFQSKSIFAILIYAPQRDEYYTLFGFRTQQDRTLTIDLESRAWLDYSDWTDVSRTFTVEKLTNTQLVLRGADNDSKYSFISY